MAEASGFDEAKNGGCWAVRSDRDEVPEMMGQG